MISNDKNVANTPSGYTFVGLYKKALAQKLNSALFLKTQPAYDSNGSPLSSEWFAVYRSNDPMGLTASFDTFSRNFQ